jgi:hypothetical protein
MNETDETDEMNAPPPTERKEYELESVVCRPGSTMTMSIRPTSPFKCQAIQMTTKADNMTVIDILVGHVSQLRPGAEIPIVCFRPDLPPAISTFDTCFPRVDFKVVVRNDGNIAANVKLRLKGIQVR